MEHEKQLVLASEQSASRRTLRVLLAESHLINRYVYELVFFHRGHVTVKIDNGNDALKELQKGGFDFAILDQQMPGLSGCDVARRWRELEQSGQQGDAGKKVLPIMIVTSDAKETTITECSQFADLVEIKPVSPYTMVNEVERFIDNPKPSAKTLPMNSVSTKPVVTTSRGSKQGPTRDSLYNNIGKSTARVDKSPQAETVEKVSESVDEVNLGDLLDLETIKTLRNRDGDEQTGKRIKSFYAFFENELLNLETALYKGDPNAYKKVSDRIADDTGRIGAKALQDQFIQLQNMDSGFVIGNSKSVIEAISQVYSDTRLAYKKHFQGNV